MSELEIKLNRILSTYQRLNITEATDELILLIEEEKSKCKTQCPCCRAYYDWSVNDKDYDKTRAKKENLSKD